MRNNGKAFLSTVLIVSFIAWLAGLAGINSPAGVQSAATEQGEDEQHNQAPSALTPDPLIQALIRDLLRAARSNSEEDFLQHLQVLREESGKESSRLVSQLIYYSIEAEGRSEDMLEVMFAGVIIEQLEIRDSQLAWAAIPYLGTEDPRIEKVVRNWLGGTEGRSAGRAPDYSHYRAFIEFKVRNGEAPPRGLVHYMYESDPGMAVLSVMRASMLRNRSEVKPILWAQHLVDDVLWKWQHGFLERGKVEPEAVEALRELAEHPRWWARLYVAEIMGQHPGFRTDDLIEALLVDPDESVRSVVLSFMAPKVGERTSEGG